MSESGARQTYHRLLVAPGRGRRSMCSAPLPDAERYLPRDYIHVGDLIAAHCDALAYLRSGGASTRSECTGAGRGVVPARSFRHRLSSPGIACPLSGRKSSYRLVPILRPAQVAMVDATLTVSSTLRSHKFKVRDYLLNYRLRTGCSARAVPRHGPWGVPRVARKSVQTFHKFELTVSAVFSRTTSNLGTLLR